MKKNSAYFLFLFIFSISSLTFAGCSKDDDDPEEGLAGNYFIEFEADGNEFRFSDQETVFSHAVFEDDEHVLVIGGIEDSLSLSLAIYDDEPVNEGMYNNTYMNDEDDLRKVVLVITRFANSEYMSFASVDNDITVSITDLTQSYVKGTFSGTVTHLQLEDSEVSITNGSFTVPRLENSMFFNNAFN